MNTIERNPDMRIGIDPMPEGCFLFRGKLLPQRAKSAGIPFGRATQWVPSGKAHRWETAGLTIRHADRERMTAAAERKARKSSATGSERSDHE